MCPGYTLSCASALLLCYLVLGAEPGQGDAWLRVTGAEASPFRREVVRLRIEAPPHHLALPLDGRHRPNAGAGIVALDLDLAGSVPRTPGPPSVGAAAGRPGAGPPLRRLIPCTP